jgi:hypothetical protein
MIDKEINKLAQSLVDGKKHIKLITIWDYKTDYNGHKALIRRSGNTNIAIAGMRPPQRECDEFYNALKIINKVEAA